MRFLLQHTLGFDSWLGYNGRKIMRLDSIILDSFSSLVNLEWRLAGGYAITYIAHPLPGR